jgi:hypothetical protein
MMPGASALNHITAVIYYMAYCNEEMRLLFTQEFVEPGPNVVKLFTVVIYKC